MRIGQLSELKRAINSLNINKATYQDIEKKLV